jgi:hypothetical protein
MADLLIPGVGKVSDFPQVAGSDLLIPGGGVVANDYVAAEGRTTKNTRAWPLGTGAGMALGTNQ